MQNDMQDDLNELSADLSVSDQDQIEYAKALVEAFDEERFNPGISNLVNNVRAAITKSIVEKPFPVGLGLAAVVAEVASVSAQTFLLTHKDLPEPSRDMQFDVIYGGTLGFAQMITDVYRNAALAQLDKDEAQPTS